MPDCRLCSLTLLFLVGLGGCNLEPTTLRGGSAEDLVNSAAEMRVGLAPDQRPVFDSLLGLIVHGGEVKPDHVPPSDSALQTVDDSLRSQLHARDLVGLRALADSARRKHLSDAIDWTQVRIASAEGARAQYAMLENLEVVSVRRVIVEGPADDYRLRVTLENRTDRALSKIMFNATLITPGRTMAWEEGTIGLAMRGGLETDERRTFDEPLPYDMRPGNAPSGAEFRLTPYALYGPSGMELADTTSMLWGDTVATTWLEAARARVGRMEAELEQLRSELASGKG